MKYGLIGERLGHSFSKEIHALLGDYEYELCELAPKQLDRFMRAKDFLGINVTMPYKAAVIPYLDMIDAPARKIGAVNTVINVDGKLYGYNTDYYGMMCLFERAKIDARGKKAAILGTGGTAKTALAVLTSLGACEILCVSRGKREGAIGYDELYEQHSDVEIIVNTTPVGMHPNVQECPIDLSRLDRLVGVIDAVYNPTSTRLVCEARKRGINAEGGLYMLVAQAAVASELFLSENGAASPYNIEKIYAKIKAKKENIVLIGMPSSGKSTVGRLLASRLGQRFVDTDELITERIGMSIAEYFEKYGEAKFREVECEVIREFATESSIIIATGGGAVLCPENVSALKQGGRIYFIDRPLTDLIPTEDRPLSKDRWAIEKLYKERYSIYCEACDIRIDADCDANSVSEKILENLK